LVLSAATTAMASAPSVSSPDVERSIAHGQRLLKAGNTSMAIERLKSARTRHPADETLAVALAHAYTKDNNAFWALNVLGEYLQQHPPACRARAWAAWIHLAQANLAQAKDLLETRECTTPPEILARLLLLRALLAEQHDHPAEVADLLRQARSVGRYYAEDHELLESLSRRYDSNRVPWATWSVDLSAGWVTNGLAGVPVDAASQQDSGSAVALVGVNFRAVPWNSASLRPMLDAQFRAQQLTDASAADYSYRQIGLRPGVLVAGLLHLELKYAFEAVHLQGGDVYSSGPLWYSEAHRGEYEMQPSDNLVLFGGGGFRFIRERVRSRIEFDQGIACNVLPGSSVGLMLGVSARWYSAHAHVHDLFGATGLGQLEVGLGRQVKLRQALSVSADVYPRSVGYFPSAGQRTRRELLPRATTGLWWPAQSALRGALEYSYTRRDSTASAYNYQDHRALLRLRWSTDSDEVGTTLVPREGRSPLESGRSTGENQPDSTAIRELMRQDEAAQRSSSCLK
jgi:hypothetical protein